MVFDILRSAVIDRFFERSDVRANKEKLVLTVCNQALEKYQHRTNSNVIGARPAESIQDHIQAHANVDTGSRKVAHQTSPLD